MMDLLIEALLFVADGPVALEDLARALESDTQTVRQIVERLTEDSSGRGLRIVHSGSRVQMTTMPEAAPVIEQFLGLDLSSKLSPAALETLAIIAYRQPITRPQIDDLRGVNSDGVIRTLMAKSLIASVGRLEQVGRPVLFGTTFEFLQYFGIKSLDELPSLPELEDYSEGDDASEG
ncbi:MAG: SMC-Scp complex subunit ScpB [Chloroflexi bacterium RBG_13_56_8]|nr:MAG: SMC-Scp complex subunit ScpB [Chloroflexi bacterium RBG_13_56_8]